VLIGNIKLLFAVILYQKLLHVGTLCLLSCYMLYFWYHYFLQMDKSCYSITVFLPCFNVKVIVNHLQSVLFVPWRQHSLLLDVTSCSGLLLVWNLWKPGNVREFYTGQGKGTMSGKRQGICVVRDIWLWHLSSLLVKKLWCHRNTVTTVTSAQNII